MRFLLLWLSLLAPVFDNGQYGDMPDSVRSWFKGVKSQNGVPCCDMADGHRTIWERRPGDARYWVPIEGEWVPVPPEAVVRNTGNPTDAAVVWYVRMRGDPTAPDQGMGWHIRCFVPASEV